MANPPRITDAQRQRLEAALLAALILMYKGKTRVTLNKLGLTGTAALVGSSALSRLETLARERADAVQRGINSRIQQAWEDTPPEDRAQALAQLRAGFDARHTAVTIPFLVRSATQAAQVDAYTSTPSADDPTKSNAEVRLWTWSQITTREDECAQAAEMSPAPLKDILAVTGGPPPEHINCSCSLDPE